MLHLHAPLYRKSLLPAMTGLRPYSSGDYKTQFAQMYEALRPIEKKIADLQLESITDPEAIDKLLADNKITAYTASFFKTKISERAAASKQAKRYTSIFLYFGLPAIFLTGLNAYYFDQEEHLHEEHEYINYPHLRIRTMKYPWGSGDTTLFHNPRVNH